MTTIKTMLNSIRYTGRILLHKWYILLAGRRLGLPWLRLIKHDLSKFSRAEFGAYRDKFFPVKELRGYDKLEAQVAFSKAWDHHLANNPHHWDHWVTQDGPEDMPLLDVREMVADWQAAGKAYSGKDDITEWVEVNYPRLVLSDKTDLALRCVLVEVGCQLP